MDSLKKYFRVNKKDISFIRFVFEACDGVAVVTTVEPKNGVLALTIPKGFMDEAEEILKGLPDRIMMEALGEEDALSCNHDTQQVVD